MSTKRFDTRGGRNRATITTVMQRFIAFSLLGASLICSACSDSGTSSLPATTVSGSVVDGPVKGGTVKAYAVGSDGTVGAQVGGSTTTAADGSYTLSLPGSVSGSIVVTVTGGAYCAGSTTAQVSSTGTCGEGTLTTLTTPMATIAQVTTGSAVTNAHVTPVSTAALPVTAVVDATGSVSGTVVKSDFDNKFSALADGKPPTATPTELKAVLDLAQKSVTLSGAISGGKTVTYNSLTLKSQFTELPQTVTYNTTITKTYTGVKLWEIIDGAGLVTTAATNSKNKQLEYCLLATSSDGYQTLYALGELDPYFGGMQSVLAYKETVAGVSQPLDESDGPFRTTAPSDIRGGRYASMVKSLEVLAAPATATATKPGCGDDKIYDDCVAPTFVVDGEIKAAGKSVTFDAATLETLANGSSVTLADGSDSYTGVLLWTLLNSSSVGINSAYSSRKNAINTMYAMVTGSDGYRAMISLGEINPSFGNKQVLVAYKKNGAPLPAGEGAVRLIVPGDVKGGRKISNVIEIKLFGAGTL